MKSKSFKLVLFLMSLVILIGSLSGCAQPAPQRIVCLAPSCVEVIYALGLEKSLVGISQYADYPPALTQTQGWIPYQNYEFKSVEDELGKQMAVVSGFMDYNPEVLEALKPTLVVATESVQSEMAETLRAAGYNVLYHHPETLDDVFTMIQDIADATGTSAKAKKMIEGYKKQIADVQAITSTLPKVKVYLEISHYGPWATGAGSPMDQIIEIAGGQNIFEDVPQSAFETTNEEIVARNPDVILTPLWPNAGEGEVTIVDEIDDRPGYETVNAVKYDRVYHYDSSLLKRPGPRQVTAILKLAYLLHPYYFQNPPDSVSPWELGKIDALYTPTAPLP